MIYVDREILPPSHVIHRPFRPHIGATALVTL